MTAVLEPVTAADATGGGVPTGPGRRGKLGGLASVTAGAAGLPLVVVFLVTFLDEAGSSAQGVLGPEIRDFFGLDIAQITTLTTVAAFVTLLLSVPIGILVDRLPRNRMIAVGTLLVGLCSLISGLAPALLLFAIARSAAGVSRAMEGAHGSYLSDAYPLEARANVFTARQVAIELARLMAPLLAGVLAAFLFWQATFIILAVPGLVLFFVALRMHEPVRGEQERRAMGADEAVALAEERPPSISEGFRAAWGVKTLRRLLFALPFLIGSFLGFANLLALYYDQVFSVGPGLRGILIASSEPAAIAGLVLGAVVSSRLLQERPAAVFAYGGLLSVVSALAIVGIAVAPVLPVAVGCAWLFAFSATIVGPATQAVLSLVVPARARGVGLSLGSLAAAPGLVVFVPLAGAIADGHGLRTGILVLAPVFLAGAAILASAGTSVSADMRAATAAALAAEASRQAAAAGRSKLLVCKDLDVGYGAVQILFGVDFEVEEGEIVALLGTNGAGKSTLLRAICGLTAPTNGAVFFDGTDITYLPAHEHAAQGIVQVPGGKGIFPGLTVGENLRLGAWRLAGAEADAAIAEVLAFFPSLQGRMDELAGDLSGGEQQMLTLSQAFLAKPRLLMIDELSLGLAPVIVEQLLQIVRAIHEAGTTIILVEQSVNVALTVAQRAVFMEKGEVRFSGPTDDLLRRPDILRSVYLQASGAVGATAVRYRGEVGPDGPQRVLEVDGLRKRFGGKSVINGISFHLDEGQILGIVGPNGAGKTTLFDLLSGYLKADAGTVELLGEDVTDLTPDVRAGLGLVRSFQDARLFPALTVAENLAVAIDRQLDTRSAAMAAFHLPNVRRAEAKAAARVDRLVELFGLGSTRDKFVRELSTGQRRIVDMACVLAGEPKVLLLDEPSSGIAQREAEELGPLLLRIQAETGASLLVIEHDMPLLLSVSDELLALELGAVVTRGAPTAVLEDPRVVASYLGTDEATIHRSGAAPEH